MKKIHISYLVATLALSACARPEVKIDASAVEKTGNGASPVGLLEVHRANSGTSFGMSVGEDMSESSFCTATVLSDGRVVTSADCIRDKNQTFDVGQMELHLNRAGTNETDHWKVLRTEERDGLAWITPETEVARARSAQRMDLGTDGIPLSEKQTTATASALSVSSPDKDGFAVAKVLSTDVEYSPAGFTYTDRETVERTRSDRRRNRVRNPQNPYVPSPGIGTDPYGRSRDDDYDRDQDRRDRDRDTRTESHTRTYSFRARGIGEGSAGAPIVLNGKVIGVLTKAGGRHSGVDNVQWLDRRHEVRERTGTVDSSADRGRNDAR